MALSLVLVLGLGLILYAYLETRRLTIRRLFLQSPLPQRHLRIVLLGDTHGSHPFESLPIKQVITNEQPDIIVFTGDLVEKPDDIECATKALSTLSSDRPVPVFFVPGNHDIFSGKKRGDRRLVERLLEKSGVISLQNRGTCIRVAGQDVWVGGVDDYKRGLPEPLRAHPGAGSDHVLRILLSHSPDVCLNLEGQRWDLLLAGHTHGGQVRAPGLGPIFTSSKTGRLFWKGPVRVGDMQVIVTQGIGTSTLPIRFLCPPEIVVIEISPSVQSQTE